MSTKGSRAVIALCLALLVLATEVSGDVVTTYDEFSTVSVVEQPLIPWWPIPCPCAGGFSNSPTGISRNMYAYTLNTASGYKLTSLLSAFNTTSAGNFSVGFNSFPSISSAVISAYSGATANGAQIGSASSLKPYGSVSLGTGTYAVKQSLVFSNPINSATLSGVYNYSIGGVTFSYDLIESVKPPNSDIVNLLNGQNAIPSSYAFQGDNNGNPNSSYPTLITSSSAPSSYWSSNMIDQPVLEMVPAQSFSAGTMFWNGSYSSAKNASITVISTFGQSSTEAADGTEVYMFLEPSSWAANSNYNQSISYLASGGSGIYGISSSSPVQGDVILPTGGESNYYLMVQWDPYWQTDYKTSGATGQFNVWLVNEYVFLRFSLFGFTIYYKIHHIHPSPSPNLGNSYQGWDGVGTGYFAPNAGDYVCFTVTYDANANTLYACAIDLNTGQSATLTLPLGSNFQVPSSGSYVFGIGASTGGSYANWGMVSVNYNNA